MLAAEDALEVRDFDDAAEADDYFAQWMGLDLTAVIPAPDQDPETEV